MPRNLIPNFFFMKTIQNLRLLCIILSTMLFTANFAYSQNQLVTESFESETMPIGWKIIDANNDGKTWRIFQSSTWPHTGSRCIGNPSYSTTIQANDYLITPKLFINETNHKVSFYGKSTHVDRPETIEVRVSTTGNEVGDFSNLLQTIVLPMHDVNIDDTMYEIDLSAYNNQAIYFAFRCISPAVSNIAVLDDITFPKLTSNVDLAAGELTNEKGLIPNYPNQMFLSINNPGSIPVHKYTVKVYKVGATNELLQTSVFTETIAPNQNKTVEFTLSLPAIGTYNLIAEVIAEGDGEETNNQTSPKEFNVVENLFLQIGTATLMNLCDFPTGTLFKSSLTQSIYDTDLMDVYEGLEIMSLTYVVAVGQNTGSQDIVMYIGETDRETLTDGNGMIPASEMQQVYSGSIGLNASGPVTISLDTPYKYSGKKNLVIMTNKTSGVYPYAGWRKTAPIKEGISMIYQNMSMTFDPNNPNAFPAGSWAEEYNYLPTTKFTFSNNDVVEVGSMSGVVTDGTNPVAGANVLIEELEQSMSTNVNGEYSFVSVRTGTYNVTASKENLTSETVNNVAISANANTVVDFALGGMEDMVNPSNLNAVITEDGKVLFTWMHDQVNVLNFEVFIDGVSKGTTSELEYLFEETFVENQVYNLGVVAHYQTGSTPVQNYEFTYIFNNIEQEDLSEVNVYPVPSDGIVNVSLRDNSSLRVIDQLGRIVHSQQMNAGTTQLDLRTLQSGVYYIHFQSSKNLKNQVRKILLK